MEERQHWGSGEIFLRISWFLQESHMEERAKVLPGIDAVLLCYEEIKALLQRGEGNLGAEDDFWC